MSTYSAKPSEIERGWIVIDADGIVVGRLASIIANRIRGKHKPIYTPHIDCGDNVIVVNAEKVMFTGKKLTDKIYYRHTGYPGGIKECRAGHVLNGAHPERILQKAVERMIPRGPLGRCQLRKLHIYSGSVHPHEAQQPKVLEAATLNPKNRRSVA